MLIVQAAAHTQYLGEIKLFFDDAGNLLRWVGHPHYIGTEIEQGAFVSEQININLVEAGYLESLPTFSEPGGMHNAFLPRKKKGRLDV